MLLRPRSLIGRYSRFEHRYINYREASTLCKRPLDPPFGNPPTPMEETLLLKRTSKKENKCKLCRLNVYDDQTVNKSSSISPTKRRRWFPLAALVPTKTSPPIASLWRTLYIPRRIPKPLMGDPVQRDSMFVLYCAIFMEGKNDPKFYAADYPKECRLSTDRPVPLDVPLSDAPILQKILAETNDWHPYARIFGKYMSGGGVLPVRISLREPVLDGSLEAKEMIDLDEINFLQSDLGKLSARRATIKKDFDVMIEAWKQSNIIIPKSHRKLDDITADYGITDEASKESDIVLTPRSHGKLDDILAEHDVTEEASKEPDQASTLAAEDSLKQSLDQFIHDHSDDIEYSERFDDNIADNYFGYQIGLTFFADCCENVNKRLVHKLGRYLSGKMSPPNTWKKENEVSQVLDEVRCNADALAAYGRFLSKPPGVNQGGASPDDDQASREMDHPPPQPPRIPSLTLGPPRK
jgi:hypothetical protein